MTMDPVQPSEGEPTEQEYTFSSYGNQIYEKVPEELRSSIAPYLKEFDTGFTKYSQEVQPKLKAYEQYGDIEQIGQASQLYDALLNNPKVIAEYLQSIGVIETPQPAAPAEQGEPVNPEYQALTTKLSDMEKIVTALGSHFQQQQKAQQEERDRATFNQLLDGLEKQHGSFDRLLVTRLIAGGADPEEAVQALKGLGQQAVNNAAKPPPPVLSGSGSIPRTQKDLSKASNQEVRDFLTSAFTAIRDQNR